MNPEVINNAFRDYYQNLYEAEKKCTKQDNNDILNMLNIPTISNNVKADLDLALSKEEIALAIDGLNSGKRAGPDGIPIDIYKKFKNKLLIPLLDMLKETFEEEALPNTLNQALIILLPKLANPPTGVKI